MSKNKCPECGGQLLISRQIFETYEVTEEGKLGELYDVDVTDNYGHYCADCDIDEEDIVEFLRGKQ